MSNDRTKALQAAQRHVSRGQFDRAIGEYRKVVHTDPTDVRTWLNIGDLYARKGDRNEAIETYIRAAQQYREQGFFRKALAVYKTILKLDPNRLEVSVSLAQMFEQLGLLSDALSTYEYVARGYAKQGDHERALETLRSMTELDPENIPVRIKYAEALSKAGRKDDAAVEFEEGARRLKEQGRLDDYLKVAERLAYHRPADLPLARELAALYLERQDPKRALSKLQLCFKADPRDIPTLELLAQAFQQLSQLPKVISVFREIARIHQEQKREDERARALKRILDLDPGDAEARRALAAFAKKQSEPAATLGSAAVGGPSGVAHGPGGPPAVVEGPESTHVEPVRALTEDSAADILILDDDEDEDVELLANDLDEVAPVPEEVVAAPQTGPPSSVPPDVRREAQIARLLTECEVFMRYGLRNKVEEQLRRVLTLKPDHVEARERLKDLYVASGNKAAAVAELMRLADGFLEEQSAAAVLYLRQVMDLDPTHEEAYRLLRELGVDSVSPPPGLSTPSGLSTPARPATSSAPPGEDDVFYVEEEADAASAGAEPGYEAFPDDAPLEPVHPGQSSAAQGGLLQTHAASSDAAASWEPQPSRAPSERAVPSEWPAPTTDEPGVDALGAGEPDARAAWADAGGAWADQSDAREASADAREASADAGEASADAGEASADAGEARADQSDAGGAWADESVFDEEPLFLEPDIGEDADVSDSVVESHPALGADHAPARDEATQRTPDPLARQEVVAEANIRPPLSSAAAPASAAPADRETVSDAAALDQAALDRAALDQAALDQTAISPDVFDAGQPGSVGAVDEPGEVDPLAPMTPQEFEQVPVRKSSSESNVASLHRVNAPRGEIEEILDEAEFFVAQGLHQEALGSLRDALSTFPNHRLILEKVDEVGQLLGEARESPPGPPASTDHSFQLARKLAEDFDEVEQEEVGSDVLDVDAVFEEFKRGVQQQVKADDTETHFDLGIAYKEMGLLDDAVGEFSLCLHDPTRLCMAETMIGLCHIEKGELTEGINHFKKGLYAESKSDREELGLYFELGRAYELLKDPKEALYYYQKVEKREPGFRDVDQRIRELSQPSGSVVRPAHLASEDIDQVFDDLMGGNDE